MPAPIDSEAIRRYLLGEAAPEESERIESEYFRHEEMLDTVAAAEQDLIEDYLAGRLAPDVETRFASHYLASPVHRRRVAIARNLRGRAAAAPRRWLRFPQLAAAALLIGVVGAAAYLLSRPAGERASLPSRAGDGVRGSASAPEGAVITLALPAVGLREGGETPTARIGADPDRLELRLERGGAEGQAPFEVAVRTVEGHEVWRGPAAARSGQDGRPSGTIATAIVPAARLAASDYIVVLWGGGPDRVELQRYYFRVVR